MSTKGTVYREDDVHIYTECFDEEPRLYFRHDNGTFSMTLPLSLELSRIIFAGIETQRRAPATVPSSAEQTPAGPTPKGTGEGGRE